MCILSGCGKRDPAADLRAYGVVSIRNKAPYCMIYVGLNSNDWTTFDDAFWHFAEAHDIRKPWKHYTGFYSGPPMAKASSDHVAFYVHGYPTPVVVARHKTFEKVGLEDPHSWRVAESDAYMPTNAGFIKQGGDEILAPHIGSIEMAPYDTNYPVADFKKLSEDLTADMQSAFTDRKVRFVSYYGEEK